MKVPCSGNCAYLGNSSGGILIDAGVDKDQVLKGLADNNIDRYRDLISRLGLRR